MNDVTPLYVLSANEGVKDLTSVFVVFKQVKLLAGGEVLGKGVYPVKVTVMEGDLPINTNACGTYACLKTNNILPLKETLLTI